MQISLFRLQLPFYSQISSNIHLGRSGCLKRHRIGISLLTQLVFAAAPIILAPCCLASMTLLAFFLYASGQSLNMTLLSVSAFSSCSIPYSHCSWIKKFLWKRRMVWLLYSFVLLCAAVVKMFVMWFIADSLPLVCYLTLIPLLLSATFPVTPFKLQINCSEHFPPH